MPTLKINKKEVLYDWISRKETKLIEKFPTKHDCHMNVYVTQKDGKYYQFQFESSYEDGPQIWGDFIDFVEVKPVEVISIKYIKA